jgi:hypothetical protein
MVAHARPPPSDPAKRLFILVIAWGLMSRSTVLESISTRPTSRKLDAMGVVNDAVQDGVAQGGIGDDVGVVASGREGARSSVLFRQKRVATSAGQFLDGLLGNEPRKTGWMRAEAAGDHGPWWQQAILGRGRWDVDALRDIVRDYVQETLANDAVLVIDGVPDKRMIQ